VILEYSNAKSIVVVVVLVVTFSVMGLLCVWIFVWCGDGRMHL
jgi:hypothetical protein